MKYLNRFEFLKRDYEDLYKLCAEAQDQHNMNKARQVIEIIVNNFGATKRHLFQRIGEISDKNNIPQNIIDAFHQVRIVGNKDSHGNEITEAEIENGLNYLFEIVVWLAIGHDKKIYRFSDFNAEDLKIVDKYLAEDIKVKRDKIKEIGIFINSLDIDKDALNFNNVINNELEQDVFETNEEYITRIQNLPLYHIGYAILDNRAHDNYTGLTFAMFHIEKNEQIIFSEVTAFTANMKDTEEDFIDGKIVVGLKVNSGKIYCDYDRVYLQSQTGDEIKLTAICWIKHGYENEEDLNQRLKALPTMPLGVAKPIRKDYNLKTQCLPFKVALYKYVQSILNFDEVFVTADRNVAKNFCTLDENFNLYGNIDKLLHAKNCQLILRHFHNEVEVICTLKFKKSNPRTKKS